MSNVKADKLQYTADFIKKELCANEKIVKNEYEKSFDDHRDSTINSETKKQYHQDNEHSCYYNASSAVPNTILITNNYSQDDPSSGLKTKSIKKSSSITIVTHNSSDTDHTSSSMPTSASSSTVVLDRINICINNHFNDPRSSLQKSSLISEKCYPSETITEKSSTEPDSTTSNIISSSNHEPSKVDQQQNSFSNGQDVLVQRKDGRFYLGTIIAISRAQCLVKFDDNTEYWSQFDELTKLSTTDTNIDPVCVVCKKVNHNDVVEVCERCGRGHHKKCAEGSFQKNGIWICRRCTARNGIKLRNISHKSQLPYNIDSLIWDSHHRVNEEQIYCYCGGNGEWDNKMLQCCKCEQWFHEKCVRCLDYPLFRGDMFYVFACSMCNNGTEFLRRIVMKWIDVVHLLLFNITINNQNKYYHVNKVIVPYAIGNWRMLQLHQNMRNLTEAEIKDKIISTLTSNSREFKSGREIKKKLSVWGLRTFIPPPAPVFKVPDDVEMSEQYLKRGKLNFIPQRSITNIPKDVDVNMFGASYLGENSDNESSGGSSDQKFTSDDELPIKQIVEKEKARLAEKEFHIHSTNSISKKSDIFKVSDENLPINENYDSLSNVICGTDSSDKSRDCVDYDGTKEDSLDIDEAIKIAPYDVTNMKRNRKRKSPFLSSLIPSEIKQSEIIDICDSSDDTSSRGTLDLIIPPPKNFQGRNHPFRLTPKKNNANNIVDKLGVNQGNKVAVKQSIIGPQRFGNVDISQAAGQFRIVRTVKRRLSAKDITIGPNKEVKRRRLRRRSGNVEVISTATIQTLPKSAAYLPIRTDSKEWPLSALRSSLNCATSSSSSSTPQATTPTNLGSISNVFNGRRLRQRQEKNYSEKPRRNSNTSINAANCSSNSLGGGISIPGSPNKSGNQSDVSLSELKTSVNMYFGAANRIASGENFVVRAKRLAQNGKTQYLIEWEGIS